MEKSTNKPKVTVEVAKNPVTKAVTSTTETTETKPVTPRARTVEVLNTIEPKDMTHTEAIKYIKHLREQLDEKAIKIANLEDNCKSAYEKSRHYAEAVFKIKTQHEIYVKGIQDYLSNAIRSIDNETTICTLNIDDIIKGGTNI